MTFSQTATVVTLCGVCVVVGLSLIRPKPRPAPAPDTVVITRSAKAETVAVTTLRVVTKTKTLLDSVFATDTLWLRDTVVRESIRTVVAQCEACANELANFRRFSDSVIRARDDSIAKLYARISKLEKQRPWYAAAGFGGAALIAGALR